MIGFRCFSAFSDEDWLHIVPDDIGRFFQVYKYTNNTKGYCMNTAEYLDRLLVKYSSAFDIYQPYVIHGKEYPAYGYFFSHTEKYVQLNIYSFSLHKFN